MLHLDDGLDNINCLFRGTKEIMFIDYHKYKEKVRGFSIPKILAAKKLDEKPSCFPIEKRLSTYYTNPEVLPSPYHITRASITQPWSAVSALLGLISVPRQVVMTTPRGWCNVCPLCYY